jgi:hypothetical protein
MCDLLPPLLTTAYPFPCVTVRFAESTRQGRHAHCHLCRREGQVRRRSRISELETLRYRITSAGSMSPAAGAFARRQFAAVVSERDALRHKAS